MLAVMPKREAEVNEWSACAKRLWESAALPRTLEASLGELQALKVGLVAPFARRVDDAAA